jgi:ABC-type lipoprotein export system ATPase subunit
MSDTLLVAENLHKTYVMGRSTLRVLRGCTLRVQAGEFVAIMGKSGSGKSTLLHMLGALDVPESGQVLFENTPVFAPPDARHFRTNALDVLSAYERQRIRFRRYTFGFVFQFYHLLPELNVLENVLLARMVGTSILDWWSARHAAHADALAVLERVGLSARLKHRPAELSGGERQRVAIARALVHRPKVLLADEPTGNLDAEAGASLMGLLKSLHNEGQTIVLVTHDPGVAAQADRTLVLENGQLRSC